MQLQTQTFSVIPIQTTKSISPTEVAGTSFPTIPTLIPGNRLLLQVPTETVRSNFDFRKDPKTSGNFTTQDKFFGATSHPFEFQNSAILTFFQTNRVQRKISM